MTNKTKTMEIRRKACWIILELIILAILLVYSFVKTNYKEVFYKNTVVNGIDCSSVTIDEATKKIKESIPKEVTIIFKGNTTEKINCSEIVQVESLKRELEQIKYEQNVSFYLLGKEYNIQGVKYNKKQLKKQLSTFKQFKKEYIEEKSELYYAYNDNKKKIEVDGKTTYYLDIDDITNLVLNEIKNGKDTVIVSNEYYKVPNKDEELKKLNSKISSSVVYQLPNEKEYVLDADILHLWLNYDGTKYDFDEKKWNNCLKKFVSEDLKKMSETVGKKRKFKPTGKKKKISIKGGNYGYQLDVDNEIEQLKEDLNSNKKIERRPIYRKEEISNKNSGLGNTYVEIDIFRQKVWVYVDGNLKVETDCVTGCVSKGYDTPTGICFLTYKQEHATLNGDNYSTPVNYWMPFNGNVGLHDATWRKSFGGDIYLTNGSHGCVNLPFDKAREIYNIVDKTMPIIVYKSK